MLISLGNLISDEFEICVCIWKLNTIVGSYNTRCMMAVSSFNFGPNYIRKLYKNVTKESPGKFTKQYIQKLQKEKMYRRKSKQCKLIFGPSTRLIYFKIIMHTFKFVSHL